MSAATDAPGMRSNLPMPMAGRGDRSFHWRFPCEPASAKASRMAVDTLDRSLQTTLLADVRLLVGELVTNSVQHGPLKGGRSIRLRLSLSPEAIQAEVRDGGHGFDAVPIPTVESESGRGLYMVSQLADRWGVSADPSTLVWFEILL